MNETVKLQLASHFLSYCLEHGSHSFTEETLQDDLHAAFDECLKIINTAFQ